MTGTTGDIRDEILRSVAGKTVSAVIVADDEGIVAETAQAAGEAARLGLTLHSILKEGTQVCIGDEIARFSGSPNQVAMAEEVLIGLMAKPSGIATATRKFVEKANGRPQIVSGAWKKMPPPMKEAVRRAVVTGGAFYRITRDPFVYLDKNYVKVLGGLGESLDKVRYLTEHVKAVQVKGRQKGVVQEAIEATQHGAGIICIDTGRTDDVTQVSSELTRRGMRGAVRIAFAGNVRLEDMESLKALDIDLVDVGRQIVDAPLLDMRMEVLDEGAK